jgi:4-hydroxy-3-polyprenylbenzoate decarboxylase
MYDNTQQCVSDLEKNGHLIRIKEEVDPYLEMAAIHLRVHELGGPALLFENVKGSSFKAASNLFGTIERSKFIFRDTLKSVQQLVELRNNPLEAFKNPIKFFGSAGAAFNALPKKAIFSKPVNYGTTNISKLPLVQCFWLVWEDLG